MNSKKIRCAVMGCTNSEEANELNEANEEEFRCFHPFPRRRRHSDVPERWFRFCGLPDDYPVDEAHVCSDHFTPDDLDREVRLKILDGTYDPKADRPILDRDAVPTIKPAPTIMKVEYRTRPNRLKPASIKILNESFNPSHLSADRPILNQDAIPTIKSAPTIMEVEYPTQPNRPILNRDAVSTVKPAPTIKEVEYATQPNRPILNRDAVSTVKPAPTIKEVEYPTQPNCPILNRDAVSTVKPASIIKKVKRCYPHPVRYLPLSPASAIACKIIQQIWRSKVKKKSTKNKRSKAKNQALPSQHENNQIK